MLLRSLINQSLLPRATFMAVGMKTIVVSEAGFPVNSHKAWAIDGLDRPLEVRSNFIKLLLPILINISIL
jgi:hypothetical protein